MADGRAKDWSAATHAGANLVMRRAVATATAKERLDWLEQALQLAQSSGALARAHRMRQERCETSWRNRN